MKTLKFRNLTKDEIEVRVGGGKTLLLYKTARVDCNILDQTVGCFNWCKRFYQVKNTMICEIGININYDDPDKEPVFVFKADGGDDDYTMEKVKAECSDSMKRAAFQWGIGRSLYTAPKIKIPDQFKDSQFFDLECIEYNEKNEISKLVITTNFGKDVVFTYPRTTNYSQNANKPQKKDILEQASNGIADTFEQIDTIVDPLSEEDKNYLQAYVGNLNANDYKSFFDWLKRKYNVSNIIDLNAEQGRKITYYLKNRNK